MDWSGQLTPFLLAALPVLARMLALVFTLPIVSSRHVPVRFRIGLAIVITLAIAPAVCAPGESGTEFTVTAISQLLVALVNDLLLGASMGLAAQVVLAGARLAGNVVESLSGMSFGILDTTSPEDPDGGQVISRLFWWTTLAVFIACGGAGEVMGGVLHSFRLWPAGSVNFDQGFLDFLVGALTNGFEFGLRAALPGIVALLVAGAVLGITQRNCPQLGGLQIGLGLKSISGLLVTSLLLLSTPWVINGGLESTWVQLEQMLAQAPVQDFENDGAPLNNQRDQAQHAATPARIRRAQAAGQIPLSRELASALLWLGALAVLLTLGGGLWQALQKWATKNWGLVDTSATIQESLSGQAEAATGFFWGSLVPILGAMAALGAIGLALQTRFAIFPELLRPDGSRISPTRNLSRLFSLLNWTTALVGIFKLIALSLVAWWILAGDVEELLAMGGRPLEHGFGPAGEYLASLLLKLVAGVCLVGLADYGIRWWSHRRQLQMTDEELRDEQRATEAPPEVEARRRLITRGNDRDSASQGTQSP